MLSKTIEDNNLSIYYKQKESVYYKQKEYHKRQYSQKATYSINAMRNAYFQRNE